MYGSYEMEGELGVDIFINFLMHGLEGKWVSPIEYKFMGRLGG